MSAAARDALGDLDAALEARAAAWSIEEAAWDRLSALLNARALVGGLLRADAAGRRIATEAEKIQSRAAALAAEVDTLADAIDGSVQSFAAIVHDPDTATWASDADAIVDVADDRAHGIAQAIDALVTELGTEAVTLTETAGDDAQHALDRLADAIPHHQKLARDAVIALRSDVAETIAALDDQMGQGATAIGQMAEALMLHLAEQQAGHAVRVAGEVTMLAAKVAHLVTEITALGQTVATLRAALGSSIDDATLPITDLRSVLEQLIDRFRHF
ncbi:hypothetical protein ASE70_01945 [Sphingomonas sp. Leaf22]|uniref:hypothetical protein n=1 Tax=Sphingomonas sp. Leaf22 TaxID=1735687 RepID=UPI0006FDA915|nr:hypothetical protein [Sphingomonas sp. Leaf22]KQM90204.1 hypothetical protein ASE70_01945 [Sphingomonas sp. Leaf22]